uniref:Uncharacterized protein n=1 Tax=Lotus japonicus TaxID=34305 RepID=I3T511_LOTJA|nr:unknown [Lotus japonicus]
MLAIRKQLSKLRRYCRIRNITKERSNQIIFIT